MRLVEVNQAEHEGPYIVGAKRCPTCLGVGYTDQVGNVSCYCDNGIVRVLLVIDATDDENEIPEDDRRRIANLTALDSVSSSRKATIAGGRWFKSSS